MKCLLIPILAAAAFAASGVAMAADSKLISPANCVFTFGAGKPGGYIDDFGRAVNSSSASHTEIICPLDRDDPRAKPASVLVAVIDASNSTSGLNDFVCKLLHASRNGTVTTFGGAVVTSGVNLAGTVLTLPVPPTHFALGTYVVYCMMPRRSSSALPTLSSITLTEVTPEN